MNSGVKYKSKLILKKIYIIFNLISDCGKTEIYEEQSRCVINHKNCNSMECKMENNKTKEKSENKDKRNKIKTSPIKNNYDKEELKNIDIQKDELENKMIKMGASMETSKNEDNRNKMEISPNKNNCEKETLENLNTPKDDIKDKDNKETSEDEARNEKEALQNVNTEKNENVKDTIETSKNEDSDKEKESKTINIQKNESIKDIIEISKNKISDVTYLARKIESAEKPTEKDAMKLYKLRVKLRHTVPPQHMIETRAGSHMPMREEIEMFEKIVPIKRGLYSPQEDDIIVANWKAFCKLHDWDVRKLKPFLRLRVDKLTYMRNTAERRKFVQFLADGLPNRTLYSVYHRFRNLYENNVQRRYTPDEDEMIIDHLENNPNLEEKRKYVDLAKVLKRTRHSIWRRYRILKRNKDARML